ncbi:MAG: 2-oxo acid dehydrogenase subunit E2, partial [Chloroflexi bacterium]|nr:2-oxo acid dehydrogenase subunit E2 [Chloroflexota bacterium]
GVAAKPGDEVPVAQVIAWILAPGEALPPGGEKESQTTGVTQAQAVAPDHQAGHRLSIGPPVSQRLEASPVAARMAARHGIDLRQVESKSDRITKADVLAHIEASETGLRDHARQEVAPRLLPASPKARRLAKQRGLDIAAVAGSGPGRAVLAADVVAAARAAESVAPEYLPDVDVTTERPAAAMSQAWRVMAERLQQAWATIPHFFLTRDVDASALVAWRPVAQKRADEKVTYTDLLVKVVAVALRQHPRLNAAWHDSHIVLNEAINVGIAVATAEGLVVPVIHQADRLTVAEIAAQRKAIVERSLAGRPKLKDLQNGTFTISNLGMYGVDGFSAIINPPQAAILAVGRIAHRVVPLDGQPAVRPMMLLTLSLDHRVVDGVRGAQFLDTVASLMEEPLALL